MKTYFKSAQIAASVALALAATTMSPVSQAVSLSDNGLGQVAIVPFYSTRGNDTYISIVNTDPTNAIAVKIRFREADNSRDARDFNIFLSPNDVWTGVVTVNTSGVPVVQSADDTCTSPALREAEATTAGMKGVVFTAVDYNGGTAIGRDARADDDVTIARTEDGHFEIIQMGASEPAPATPETGRNIAGYTTHDSGYRNCDVVVNATISNITEPFPPMTVAAADQFEAPIEVMKVTTNIIDVAAGVASMVPVTTLQGFLNVGLLEIPASASPNLNSAEPPNTVQIINGVAIENFFENGADAVSSLIMATEVINEFAVGGAAQAANDWVVTFPTKNFYVDGPLMASFGLITPPRALTAPARAPFTQMWVGVEGEETAFKPIPGSGLSCEPVAFNYFNREEGFPTAAPEDGFSPTPSPDVPRNSLCFETQTLQFGEKTVLNGRNNYGVPLADGYTSGWLDLQFTGTRANTIGLAGEDSTQAGLPVLSFGVKAYTNGVTDTRGILNYGFTQPAAFRRAFVGPTSDLR